MEAAASLGFQARAAGSMTVSEADPATAGAPRSETHLVESARAGDRVAFGALYRRFVGLVHGVLLARVRRADVEDLAQDVFVSALERLASLRDPTAFGPWIAAIARNRARDHYRRSRPTEPFDDRVANATANENDAEALAVLAVVRTLPEAYRETLLLRFVEGMTGPEIAAATGLTPGSVRVNLHRGVKLLREQLGRTWTDE